jgi:hypothetical protein
VDLDKSAKEIVDLERSVEETVGHLPLKRSWILGDLGSSKHSNRIYVPINKHTPQILN